MKKLKLEIGDLKVESFEAGDVQSCDGTVRGLEGETAGCDSIRICAPTEAGTVDVTCNLECTYTCGYPINCTQYCP